MAKPALFLQREAPWQEQVYYFGAWMYVDRAGLARFPSLRPTVPNGHKDKRVAWARLVKWAKQQQEKISLTEIVKPKKVKVKRAK